MNLIDLNSTKEGLQQQLKSNGWLYEVETLQSIQKPGDGNMNVVLRIITNKRSFILKQSRPYVAKYQDIGAPLARIDVEYQFYRTVKDPLAQSHFPAILAYDPSHYLLQMEDLGDCRDMTYWYQEREIQQEALDHLIDLLSIIHAQEVPPNYPKNLELRQLNHQHIFVLPFLEDNGFGLDDVQKGLQALSLPYKKDAEVKALVATIGDRYLEEGNTLLHGDYYPGSWMSKKGKVFVIDPEFSFAGFPEFDLGVMAAHAIMATADKKYLKVILREYQGTADASLVSQVAGVEIMRRLIGLAQLPMERSLDEKEYLLRTARQMILL